MPEVNEPCPFRGLEPYTPETAEYFFGREREQAIVAANLFASPLTIVYGRSGVGKSSLLGGGIIPRLASSPRTVPVYFRAWKQEGFLKALKLEVAAAVARADPTIALDSAVPLHVLVETAAREFNGAILVILDQFEDYLLHGADTEGGQVFQAELARTVSLREVDTGVLIAIRDDFLSQLQDRFKGRMPVLRNTFRLRHLDAVSAERAIRETLSVYNQRRRLTGRPDVGIEDNLIREIISWSKVGKVPISESAGAGLPTGHQEPGIELSFLQLILKSVWEAERSDKLRADTLSSLGGAPAIVRDLVKNAIDALSEDQRVISARMFRFLVMPSGAKIAQSPADLAAEASQPLTAVEPVLHELTRRRILTRTDSPERYEVFHDVFAPAVLDWRVEFQKKEELREEARRARIYRNMSIALGVLFVCAVTAAWYAYVQSQRSRSRELAAAASSQLGIDPERAISLALYALDATHTAEAEDSLHRAVLASRVRETLRLADCATPQMARSTDAARTVAACADGSLRFWEQGRPQVTRIQTGLTDVRAVAISSDGALIAVGGGQGVLRLWNPPSGAPVGSFPEHGAAIESIAFTRDAGRAAVAIGSTAVLLDAASGAIVRSFSGHTGAISSVAVSDDGTTLATASLDGSLRLWDLISGGRERVLFRGKDPVWSVAISRDGRSVAAAMADRTVRRWDAGTGAELNVFTEHSAEPRAVAFSPDGDRLASAAGDRTARLWNLRADTDPVTLAGHTGIVRSISFGLGSNTVITASDDGTVRTWDAGPNAERFALQAFHAFNGIVYSPDGKLLIAPSADATIHIADAVSGREIATLSGHESDVFQAVSAADGSRIASGGNDSTARVWSWPDRRELWTLRHPPAVIAVNSVAFSRGGDLLLSGGSDGYCRLWNANAGTLWAEVPTDHGAIQRVAFNRDGSRFAAGFADGAAVLWATQTRTLERTLRHAGAVRDLAFGSDGRIVTADAAKRVSVWSAAGADPTLTISEDATALAFNDAGTLFATGGGDGAIRVWNSESGKLLLTLGGNRRPITGLSFSRDDILASSSQDGSVRVYVTSLSALRSLARQRITNPLTSDDCRRFLQKAQCPAQ